MPRGDIQVPYPLGVTQTVAYSTSARTGAGVGSQTRTVAIYASTDCAYKLGDDTVIATLAGGTFLPAGQQHFVRIRSGEYVAAIATGAGGDMYVSEFGS